MQHLGSELRSQLHGSSSGAEAFLLPYGAGGGVAAARAASVLLRRSMAPKETTSLLLRAGAADGSVWVYLLGRSGASRKL